MNPHQSFYCYGQCGQLYTTDISQLQYCSLGPNPPAGQAINMFSCGAYDVNSGCIYRCRDVCYPPPSTANPALNLTDVTDAVPASVLSEPVVQCMNIGAWIGNGQALKQAQGAFWGR